MTNQTIHCWESNSDRIIRLNNGHFQLNWDMYYDCCICRDKKLSDFSAYRFFCLTILLALNTTPPTPIDTVLALNTTPPTPNIHFFTSPTTITHPTHFFYIPHPPSPTPHTLHLLYAGVPRGLPLFLWFPLTNLWFIIIFNYGVMIVNYWHTWLMIHNYF